MRELVAKPSLLIFVIMYFVLLIGIGIYYSKKIKEDNAEDFVLAGKGLGPIVLMGTFLATYVGNGTISGGVHIL